MDSDGSRSITSSNDSLESYERVESTFGRTDVFDFPKVELHCHLDGCFRLETVIKYAIERKIELPTYDVKKLQDYCVTSIRSDASLETFLQNMSMFLSVFKGSTSAIRELTLDAIQDKAKDGVVYVEMRYCPQLLSTVAENKDDLNPLIEENPKDRLKPSEVVHIVNQACQEAEARWPTIKVRTILCCIVPLPMISKDIAKLCLEFKDDGVVGIDIAGSEDYSDNKQFQPHIDAFQFCRKHNIRRTAHAGEAQGAESVNKALDLLAAERIGHGYHVLQEESIYKRCLSGHTHFECCPISSYRTGSVNIKEIHPIVQFVRDGLNCSISTDDPGLMLTTLINDYKICSDKFGFSDEILKKMNLNAAKSCFLPEDEKRELVNMLTEHYY